MQGGQQWDPIRVTPVATTNNKRRHGRVRCQEIRCSLGDVVDISASGMRCRTRIKPPKNRVFAIVIDGLGDPITVGAKAVWTKRVGLFSREVGLVFEIISPESIQGLQRLARAAAHNEFFRDDDGSIRYAG